MTEKYYAFLRSVYTIDDVISETDHYIISERRGRMKKITDNSAILDTFEDAKQWLIDHENRRVEESPKRRCQIEEINIIHQEAKITKRRILT